LFREGGVWTELPKEILKEEFEKLLEIGTDQFDLFGFSELIGFPGNPYLSAEEIFQYLLKAKTKQNLYNGIVASLGEFLFLGQEDEIALPVYEKLWCRITEEKNIPEDVKMTGFTQLLETDLPTYEESVRKLYDCIGLERAIQLYAKKKLIPAPEVTKKDTQNFINKNFETLRLAVTSGLVSQNEIFSIYQRTGQRNAKSRKLIELFDKTTLDKLEPQEVLEYVEETYFYNPPEELLLYHYTRNTVDIQQLLAQKILVEHLDTKNISIFTVFALTEMMRLYAKQLIGDKEKDIFHVDNTEEAQIEIDGYSRLVEGP
jgi:hypothetical protein